MCPPRNPLTDDIHNKYKAENKKKAGSDWNKIHAAGFCGYCIF